jgi:molybdate transport system substrate-binding protein
MLRRAVPLLLVASVLLVPACGSGGDSGTTTLRVFAAASLTDAFADVGAAFGARYPDVTVALNLAGSATLRTQILEGAPADVFAPADESHMTPLTEAGALRTTPEVFATNRMIIAVPTGNPGGVVGLADFARSDLLLGLCAVGVPCGDLARDVLAAAGVEPSLDTEEPDVRSLLTKIGAGELDAGIVYVTDVLAHDDLVDGVEIADAGTPDADRAEARYPIAVLREADPADVADAFVAFVLSADGRAILAAHGFGLP